MPYHSPIPEPDSHGKSAAAGKSAEADKRSGAFQAWVQAEKFIQIILVLPSAAFIGWAAGFGLDRAFHKKWISMAGIVFGIIAGLVCAIRMAIYYTSKSDQAAGDDPNQQS